MSVIHIIGCGPSAKSWDGKGLSIGVNDCWRWRPTTYLIVLNPFSSVNDFRRQQIIWKSDPKYLFSQSKSAWGKHPKFKQVLLFRWRNEFQLGRLYEHSISTPFTAVCLAANYNERPSEIVMWGVDFIDHPVIKGEILERCKKDFSELHSALFSMGISLYICQPGALDLPVWDRKLVS